MCALFFVESPAENLRVPDNSRSGSDGTQPFNRSHNGVANGFGSQPHTDLGDSEVQEIFGNSVGTTTVQVLVEMNGEENNSTDAGQMLVYLAYNLVCVQQLANCCQLSLRRSPFRSAPTVHLIYSRYTENLISPQASEDG